jgi:anthranilate phosphoribosyltransferase
LPTAGVEGMLAPGPPESATIIRAIFSGQRGAPRDIVVLNAAAALWLAGRGASERECARLAATAIDSGAATDLLTKLAQVSRR